LLGGKKPVFIAKRSLPKHVQEDNQMEPANPGLPGKPPFNKRGKEEFPCTKI